MLAPDHIKKENARQFKYREINRLIIIGNGFDLAHGLKTSFKDFIEDYFHQILQNIKTKNYYEDNLISISSGVIFYELNDVFDPNTPVKSYKKLRELMNHTRVRVERESLFLKNIYSEIEVKSWVDIELIYFKMLKEVCEDEGEIRKLNSDLNFIKTLLIKYLRQASQIQELKKISKLDTTFKEKVRVKEAQPNTISEDKKVKSTCILNFNYTDTPELYLNEFFEGTFQHIKIHGGLDGNDISSQGPVFGFGDELDEDYLKFENMENDELFEHIKSFKYLQFQNYRNLLDFIERNPFQVQVYGHSLGLSDRTLLNTIFEHENCISIKLFYHKWEGGDDFEKKTFAISRHFRSKASLRSKVVNKEFCEPMGQSKQV